ncbi:MAG: IclR family transcriptional regulator [Intrasporangium sp.]|uniref:IclR family transcriptional regulator n=1 Tax=Intrasporangium sp. TaxID=1925024 RepID=UPI003F811E85
MNGYTIEAVSRAMRTLDALAQNQPATLAEIAQAVEANKATIYRVLATLVEHDMVVQDPQTKRYNLGPRLITLGHRALESADAINAAIGEGERLAGRHPVVVTVNVAASNSVIEAARLPRHGGGEFAPLGTPIPFHASASGLVFLAHSPSLLDRVKAGGLPKMASRTFTSPQTLDRELRRIHETGFALVEDTLEEGVTALAAPVFDHMGSVTLTLGAAGPTGATTPDGWQQIGKDLLAAVHTVTQRIGGVPQD